MFSDFQSGGNPQFSDSAVLAERSRPPTTRKVPFWSIGGAGLARCGSGRKIGYARVSTEDQTTRMQRDALEAVPCDLVFVDEDASGANLNRPAFADMMAALRPGDTVIVWRFDRLGRSVKDLSALMEGLQARDIGVVSLTEPLDPSSITGEVQFYMMAIIAQAERRMISERTIAGIAAARRRGVVMGRPPKLSRIQVDKARERRAAGETMAAIAKSYRVSPQTLRRALQGLEVGASA